MRLTYLAGAVQRFFASRGEMEVDENQQKALTREGHFGARFAEFVGSNSWVRFIVT